MNTVSFPGLGLEFTLKRLAIPLPLPGGGIHWYALIIVAGVIAGGLVAAREVKRLGGSPQALYDAVLFCFPVAIICARLYYVLFTLEDYIQQPLQMLYVWEGGIAIYGAIIGGFLSGILYFRLKKLDAWVYLDAGAFGFFIGQAIGRWGNFVNAEAYGMPCDFPWRMVINNSVTAHPTFLYESLWNLVGFAMVYAVRKKITFRGGCFSLYLIWYGLGRIWIEALRTDSLMLGNMKISIFTSILAIILGIFLFLSRANKARSL